MDASESLSALRIDRTRRRSGAGSWLWLIIIVLVIGAVATPLVLKHLSVVEVSVATASKITPGTKMEGSAPGGVVLSAAGYVVADRQSVLAAKVTGKLSKMNVSESQVVPKGFLVAEVDHTEIDAVINLTKAEHREALAEIERLKKIAAQADKETQAAKAPLKTYDAEIAEMKIMVADAERRLKRDKDLAENRALPSSEVDDRVTEVRMSNAKILTIEQRKLETLERVAVAEMQTLVAQRAVAVAEARAKIIEDKLKVQDAQLKDHFVIAPFDGVISEKAAEVGEIVAPISVGGQMARGSVATLADWASLQAEVDVSEQEISKVKPGMRAAISVDAIPEKVFPGVVKRVLPRANRSKATVQVRVDFLERDEKAVLPEMGIRVQFLHDEAPKGLETGAVKARVVVPANAVQQQGSDSFVWLVVDNAAVKRVVKTGETEDGRIEIKDGVSPGDKVVVAGAEKLKEDKQAVKVKEPGK
jgi:HlyD family secretion protein